MLRAKPILGFLGRFLLVFALLAAPWPGWPEAYARGLRQAAQAVYGSFGSQGVVVFRPNPEKDRTLDTIIYVGNRDRLDARQGGPAACFTFNSRGVAYLPTALVIALVLATGLPWRRRAGALGWALVWMHLFIAGLLGLMLFKIVDTHPWLGLFQLPLLGRQMVSILHEILLTYSGARSAVAVLIWILATFRRDEWIGLLGEAQPTTNAGESRR